MKSTWTAFLGLLMLAVQAAQAQFIITTNNGSITITGYNGPTGAVAIPATINGLLVTSVGENSGQDQVFAGTGVTSVSMGANVAYIGEYAFYNCTSVTNVTISESVTNIDAYAFESCTGLSSVTISNGVTSIGYQAFYGCTSLASITIPGSVTNFGQNTFQSCSGLTNVTISNGVTSVGSDAFYYCTGLISISLPDTLTNIGSSAFQSCSSLTNVAIPGSVASIGDYAFYGCTGLTNATISNGVASIGYETFYDCASLTSMTIPNSVTTIGGYAFYDCTGLVGVSLPDSVTEIGQGTFQTCTSLANVALPGSVGTLDDYAFYGCSSLTNATLDSSLTNIGYYAFYGCTSLTNITIPGSVAGNLGQDAFANCTSLTSVFFEGIYPGPIAGLFAGENTSTMTVYYFPGASGWGSQLDGFQTIGLSAIAITANPTNGFVPLTANFTSAAVDSASQTISNWNWSFGDGATSAAQNPSHTYTTPGTFSATLIATNSNGVPIAGAIASITVSNLTLAFTANPNNGVAPLPVSFASGNVDSAGHAVTNWNWSFGDGATSTAQNPSHIYETAGSFIPILVAGNDIGYAVLGSGPSPIDTYSFTCATNHGTITITGYIGSGGAVTIPGTFNGLPVTSLGNGSQSVFENTGVTSVTIPGNVTNIAAEAFYQCSSLTNVTISNGVTTIGQYGFGFCYGLASITIPNSVTNIGTYAFYDCTGLTNVTISNPAASVGADAFYYCTSLASITIPGNAGGVFSDNPDLTSVVIDSGATNIADSEFSGLTSLASITIPGSVTSIGFEAFYGCTSLTNVTISNGVTSIGAEAFWDCASLTSVAIPKSVTNIGYYAFAYCFSLTSITISNGLATLGNDVFYYCTNLVSVTIPGNAAGVFYDNPRLTSVTFGPGATNIAPSALNGLTSLTNVTIPASVTNIGDSAFYGCTSLARVTIHVRVTNIGNDAFYGCTSLASITIPGNAAGAAFSDDPDLTSVTIAAGSTSIGSEFSGLTSITSVTIPGSVTSIGNSAFYGCTKLAGVMIPGSVTSIGNFAFYGCTSLAGVAIPNTVTSIGDSAFYGFTILACVTIPNSITAIGNFVFYGCTKLAGITIPYSVTSIGNSAFYGCTSLATVTIPGGVTSLGYQAFSACSSLTGVYFEGNAPPGNSASFANDIHLTNYYLSGTSGWGSTFEGFPTSELPAVAIHVTPSYGATPYLVNLTSAAVDSLGHSISNWTWTFGDGATSAAQDTSHTYTAVGNFSVALFETNAYGVPVAGAGASAIATITPVYSGLVLNGAFATGYFNGWTLSGDTSATFVDNGSQSGIPPNTGNFEAALGTSGSSGYLSQTVATTAGATYLLSFWVDNPDADPGEFVVTWNGQTLVNVTNLVAPNWTYMQYAVSATGPSTVLQFEFVDDYNNLALDGITVTSDFIQYTATPTAGFAPLTVQFASPAVDNEGHAITNWLWNFGDGSFNTSQNPSHVYAGPGAYPTSLVVSNNVNSQVTCVGPGTITAVFNSGLVVNGGFETGGFTGWTLISPNFTTKVDNGAISGIPPYSGNFEAASDAFGALDYLSQTLATTPGASYTLSLWLDSPDGVTPNKFLVSWNGNILFDQRDMPALGWTNLQFLVSATGASTVLQFGFRDDNSYLALDNVSVLPSQSAPGIASFSLSGTNLVVNGSNGQSGATYYVLMTTNLSLPLSQWTPVATNILGAGGNFTITATNTVSRTNPHRFYILETQ